MWSTSIIAIITLVCSNQVFAQNATYAVPNSKIAWQNQYPVDAAVPKAEWLALVKEDAALQITPNILTVDGVIQNADATGNNTYCNWTWDGCVKPTDIVSCEDPKIWGTVTIYKLSTVFFFLANCLLYRVSMMDPMKSPVNY